MPVNPPDPSKPPEQWSDDTLLAVTLWGEARGESVVGMAAVANVIMNRYNSGRSSLGSGSIAKVVLRKWQFSCWNTDDPNAPKLRNPQNHDQTAWLRCAVIAELALAGAVGDVTKGATHYCTNNLWNVPRDVNHPRWHDEAEIEQGRTVRTVTLGNHTFAKAA